VVDYTEGEINEFSAIGQYKILRFEIFALEKYHARVLRVTQGQWQ